MKLRLLSVATISVFLLGCGVEGPVPSEKKTTEGNPGAAAPSSATVDYSSLPPLGWSPDPNLLDQLKPAEVEGLRHIYRLRPPSGWEFSISQSGGEDLFGPYGGGYWCHKASGCSLYIRICDVRDADFEKYFHWVIEINYSNVKKSPPEKGRIGGLDFTRYRYTFGIPNIAGHEERAVLYLANDESRLVVLQVRAPANGCEKEFRLAESAILTLQKP